MNTFDRQQAFAALLLLAMALFVATGFPPAARWRGQLRIGSIIIFSVAIVIAIVEIVLWWAARAP